MRHTPRYNYDEVYALAAQLFSREDLDQVFELLAPLVEIDPHIPKYILLLSQGNLYEFRSRVDEATMDPRCVASWTADLEALQIDTPEKVNAFVEVNEWLGVGEDLLREQIRLRFNEHRREQIRREEEENNKLTLKLVAGAVCVVAVVALFTLGSARSSNQQDETNTESPVTISVEEIQQSEVFSRLFGDKLNLGEPAREAEASE